LFIVVVVVVVVEDFPPPMFDTGGVVVSEAASDNVLGSNSLMEDGVPAGEGIVTIIFSLLAKYVSTCSFVLLGDNTLAMTSGCQSLSIPFSTTSISADVHSSRGTLDGDDDDNTTSRDGEDAAATTVVDVFLGDRVVLSFFVSAVIDRLAGTALLLLLVVLE
jgi:hypothetical protein